MEFTTIQIQDENGNWQHLPIRKEDSPFNEYTADFEPLNLTYTEQKILDDLNCDINGDEIPTEPYHHELADYSHCEEF